MIKVKNEIKVENAVIKFKNFSGISKSNMDREGDRKFVLVLPIRDAEDERIVQEMIEEGWYVKIAPPREEGDDAEYRLLCHLGNFSPKIYKIIGDRIIELTDETIPSLDKEHIVNVDVGLRGSYNRHGNGGITSYVDVMRVYVEDSILSDMYEN